MALGQLYVFTIIKNGRVMSNMHDYANLETPHHQIQCIFKHHAFVFRGNRQIDRSTDVTIKEL